MDVLPLCLCITCTAGVLEDQKRALDALELMLETVATRCSELNPGPLEEQLAPLIHEQSL